ncbi:MAG TPA: helix-turn-helix domain-containing protein [Actinomycetota bacterium]|nr:helix-turn-helix domain-containing protein [Actinomycetota bacterium]
MNRTGWHLLSHHGRALRALSRRPHLRIRDLAGELGLTERSAQSLVSDLVASGLVERTRQGRRNRYVVRTEPDGFLGELPVGPGDGLPAAAGDASCEAVVLACSDYRTQAPLLRTLASEGLLGRSELVLWPGGGPALAGRDRDRLFEEVAALVVRRRPSRLLLVSHAGCAVPEVPRVAGGTIFETYRAVQRWARRIVRQSRATLGMVPELWLIDRGRVGRVPGGALPAQRTAWREAR